MKRKSLLYTFLRNGVIEWCYPRESEHMIRTVLYADGDVITQCLKHPDIEQARLHNEAVSNDIRRLEFRLNSLHMGLKSLPILGGAGTLYSFTDLQSTTDTNLIGLLYSIFVFWLIKHSMTYLSRTFIAKKLV